jgi:hypothetical protein
VLANWPNASGTADAEDRACRADRQDRADGRDRPDRTHRRPRADRRQRASRLTHGSLIVTEAPASLDTLALQPVFDQRSSDAHAADWARWQVVGVIPIGLDDLFFLDHDLSGFVIALETAHE